MPRHPCVSLFRAVCAAQRHHIVGYVPGTLRQDVLSILPTVTPEIMAILAAQDSAQWPRRVCVARCVRACMRW